MSRPLVGVVVAVGLLAGPASGCGKKGPPLAPLLHLPAPVAPFSARRFGSTVYVQFTIPAKNQDNSTPADLSRVDVYAYTGTLENDDEIVKYGTVVARVPVRRPPQPEEEDRARGRQQPGQATSKAGEPGAAEPKAVAPEPGFDQGATVTVTETLTPPVMQPVAVARRSRGKKSAAASEAPILPPPASLVPLPQRVYVAVGVNRKNHRGSFSTSAAVPLLDAPAPPTDVKVSHTETAITVEWAPPPGAPAPPVSDAKSELLPATRGLPAGGPTWSYQVYELPPPTQAAATSPAALGAPPGVPAVAAPAPLNPQPLPVTKFTDSRIEFGTERCYVVRAVKAFAALREESEASNVACITPRDIYPPAAPKGLTAVSNGGAISLIWDANTEKDLDGYLVLRGEAPGGTLQPLMREPIHDTTFNDTTVKPGMHYTYAIVAVDKAGNASAQSNRIEETAR